MHNENKPLLALMFLPTMKEMTVTGNAQKLHPVNPILMKRNTLTNEEEHSHKRRRKSSSGRGVGTKVMKKALAKFLSPLLLGE